MRHSIQSYIAAEDLDEPAKPKFFSRATLMKVVYFLSDVVYSLALLGCGVLRANGISSMYLFGWVLGTMYTFKSRVLSVFTLLVSACAIAGHIYAAVSFTKTSSPHILFGLFGFAFRDDAWDITLNAGPDVLMFLISILQVYVVQKQIRTALPVATLQAAAASVRGDDGMSTQDARSNVRWRENVLGASEFFVFAALFVAAFATTGFVSFVYYLFLLQRLAAWTLFPKALSLQELEDGASHYRPFFGAKTIRLLLAYSILVIAICQAYQFPDVHNSSIGPDLGNYTGLFVMPGTSADWSGYVFYATQCVLFIAVARTLPNYAKWQAARNALPQTNEASSPSHRSSSHASFYSAHESPLDSATSNRPVQELLSHEPFFVRLFLEERGILWATLAAIFWSVSYPSYMNAGLLAIALVLLATFGLVLPRKLLVFLNVYAFGVSIATVVFLLPLDWTSKLTTLSNLHMIQIGIATSEFPLLDLSVQHLCVLVICCCVRVRLQYQYIVKEVRVERELHDLQHAPSVYDDMMASGTQTPGHAIPVHENLQLHRMRSVEVTKLWIKDAQSIFIASLDMTVLFTIFVTVLSTSVTILQTGYLALATFLSVFQRFRRQLWRALLVYALVVCLAMYSWNVVCPQSVDKTRFDTIGLTCFRTYPRSNWAALWPTLFSAQLFLIFQVVLQLCIYLRTDNGADERARMLAQANRRPIYFVSRLAREVDHIFRVLGIAVAYIGFVVVAFVYEVNDAGHFTLVGLIQVLLLFTLLGSHLSTVVQCPRGNSLKTQRQWRLVLAYEAFVLVTRYLYQFQGIASWVQGQWPDSASRVISIRDVGYVQYASTERLSGLFMYLFPTACLAGLVTWNLASMRKKLHNYDVLVRGRSNWMDSFCTFLELCQRMVYFNSPIVLLVVNMAIVCSNISAFNITYLGVLIVTLGRPQWTHCWKPIFWLSSVFTLCLYAFQFEAFQPAKLEVFVGGHAADAFEHSAVWFGLARIATSATNRTVTESITAAAASSDSWNAGDATYPSMWALTGEHMLVLLLCIITRVSHFWDPLKDVPAPAVKRQSSLASEPWAPVGMADETPFLESLQSFLVRFTSEGSVILTMLLLLVSSFIHRNIISVVYMLVVRAIMVASPLTVCIRWYLIAGLVVFVCVSQYFIMLWVPPFLNWHRESLPPWTWCTPAYEYFFALHYQHRWALFCDYLVLLVTFMIPAAKPYYLAKHGKNLGDTPRQDISLLEPAEAKGDEDYTPIVVQPGYDVDDFTVTNAANTTLWQLCLFVVMNFWIFALLIVVFITGCVRSGIASGIYLGFSIYMLLHVQRVGSPGDKLLRWLRDFTWFYMFASILFQLPFFTDKTVTCALGTNDPQDGVCLSIPSIFDLNKYPVSYPGAPPYFASLPVLSVVIFWMINIQELIFQSPLYAYIHAHTQREEDLSDLRRSRLTDAILKERLVRWTALKQDKAAAIVRLKSIVSRLVNKVEEMMDIAMGLNYSLPPSAPEKPFVQPDEATQNSITLHWKAPEAPIHRIRAYKVTRQMYPTSTLLGDYSDPIEVAASAGTSLVVEGLRPGAAYQFKVAAISRMGEGPFSAPSEPARTISLNWGGLCLAGWVHYTKAALPKRWYASLWSPKPIVRYIVVDTHAFVWYKSENVALKHRSTKKRKRMKTSFLMRNVLSMDLSEEPIRLDDNSSPIHTLDVVATLRNSNAQVQYSFHLERADDFDKWAAALGQMLPRDVLSDRFLAYLELHGLPMPLEADENDEDEVEDGAKNAGGSEWSSVTGDESWLGDAEDEEMAKRPTYGWIWLKIYQALYNAQDAALRQEHQLYEDDDEILPSFLETLFVLINAIRSHSRDICCLTFMCSFMFQGDLLNAFYVLATFGFVLLENPRPHSGAWHFFLVYSFVVVSLRYSFQLPFFCQQFTKKNVLYPSIQPFCPTDLSVFTSGQLNPIQPMVIFGLYKFDGTANPHVDTMLRGVAWNFIVILAILFHRRELQLRGMWYAGVSSDAADDKNPQQSIMGRQSTRMSTRRGSNLSVDSLDLDDYEVADFLARHEQAKRATEPTELPRRRVLPKSQRVAFQDSDSPRSLDAELDATADEVNDASPPLAPTSPQHAQQLVVAPLPSALAPEPEHRSLVKKNKALEWCKAHVPSGVVQFCRRVISPAPEHWDRNINKAITGVKPGRDYYLLLLFLPLVSIVYVILLFQYFGEPNTSSDSFSLQLSDSMLNGYMVLIVFCELVVMIWDRAAYVYGSMISKMVLHFVFLLAVHIGLWILLPMYSQSYFQTRLGLQGLYLLQCFYLWTSAQQLKYGYLVFRGHHFVKKPGADVTVSMLVIEKCFKIYYAVPFAFEIRCLLDWICSTTALDMEMWFLLEEIAAEMYLVRQEMNGRIDNADFLQGNKRQPLFFKLLKGGILLLLLLVCVIGPLAIFSTANPSTSANPITATTVSFGLQQLDGTVQQLYASGDTNSPAYAGLQITSTDTATQKIAFASYSQNIWTSTPPMRRNLVAQINSTEPIKWLLSLTFTRSGPDGKQTVSLTFDQMMTPAHRTQFISVLLADGSTADPVKGNSSSNVTGLSPHSGASIAVDADTITAPPIVIAQFYTPVLKVGATSDPVARGSFVKRSILLQRNSEDGVSWWAVSSPDDVAYGSLDVGDAARVSCADPLSPMKDGLCLVTVSDNIVNGLTSLGIGTYGITAAYIFVIFTIGGFVKNAFRGELYKVLYKELPNPNELLELVEGVYIARKEDYLGHLKDEGRLYETLIRVLRSPETLLKVTGPNVIHIPVPKDKID
ncbi:hypothetical protein SPRG_20361 [Saprolegnia parasitica CBS 223.65]|uniref:Fibronectin type-III domain-containing protein n=1 Tax=Saprolegnia parasitica (strain CBS 223.65) TaxID=695850 RepID=A0A067CAD0_SAPPC|nr:hypothetical protein SPRG_20361 [Saprolegnia parasitica CBS 223.65]KDO27684.1 hypothetical protein SPRG_20361 [Saprolegnia parasitica CBS 223.65]|eukprot:XP_012201597.1 hypothetical protein SPRG_20361 [Saprolegnia parasitica CBS 223.65]